MIDAFLGHVSKVLSGPHDFEGADGELLKTLTAATMLDRVHRIRMNDLNQLHVLYDFLERRPNVRLATVYYGVPAARKSFIASGKKTR